MAAQRPGPCLWRVRLNGVALDQNNDTPDRAALTGAGFGLVVAATHRPN
jgi:hypothetical protein